MTSDDTEFPGSPAGGGSRRQGISRADREEGGTETIGDRELKTVRLVCVFCRSERIIHVPVLYDTPKEVYWECLTCQERWASRE